MMSRLDPCPWCGGKPDEYRVEYATTTGPKGKHLRWGCTVRCTACQARGPEENEKDEAVRRWNALPAPCPNCARLERERDALQRRNDAQVETYIILDAANKRRHIELYEMEKRLGQAETERDALRARVEELEARRERLRKLVSHVHALGILYGLPHTIKGIGTQELEDFRLAWGGLRTALAEKPEGGEG